MRILMVTGSLPPMRCGVGDYSLRLARALAAAGDDVAILTSGAAAVPAADDLTIYPAMDRWTLAELRYVLRAIRRWKPEVVHLQYPTQGYSGRLLPSLIPLIARMCGVRVVCTWHEIPQSLRWLPRFLLESWPAASGIVVRPNFDSGLHPLMRRLTRRHQRHFIAGASALPRSRADASARAKARHRYLDGQQRLVVFFGFIYWPKGVDLLFDIATPFSDRLVIAGATRDGDVYHDGITRRAAEAPWTGRATLTGYLSDNEAADLLACADVVVLPFRHGGGVWNSSLHAAVLQGTPVVTTSTSRRGLDAEQGVFYTASGDVAGMRIAIDQMVGTRRPASPALDGDEWENMAERHRKIYMRRRSTSARHEHDDVSPLAPYAAL